MASTTKRDEILRVAQEIFVEQGFNKSPMALITDRARVGVGTIYRNFENKDRLIDSLYQEIEHRVYHSILKQYDPKRSIRERFNHLGTMMLSHFIQNPLDYKYIVMFHSSPYSSQPNRDLCYGMVEVKEVFANIFAEGISQRTLKKLPLSILFALAFGPIFSVTRHLLNDDIRFDEKLKAYIIRACWDAIRR